MLKGVVPGRVKGRWQPGHVVDALVEVFAMEIVQKKGTSGIRTGSDAVIFVQTNEQNEDGTVVCHSSPFLRQSPFRTIRQVF